MSQIAGPTFAINPQSPYPWPQIQWGSSPYATQGLGIPLSGQLPYAQPWSGPPTGYGLGSPQPLQQVLQLLQIVPHQLQQVQLLQQQQLLHLQQLLQFVPAQLQQLQQLIQSVPHQVQQLQQGQPFGPPLSGPLGFGLVPQAFGGPASSHVM
jgi:hypothetical protein